MATETPTKPCPSEALMPAGADADGRPLYRLERCTKAAGHKGNHENGPNGWVSPDVDKPRPPQSVQVVG